MGCGSSASTVSDAKKADFKGVSGSLVIKTSAYTQIINEKSPHIRLDHIDEPKVMQMDGKSFSYKLHYCYVSQRGYYPNSLGKANQDSYLICESLFGNDSCHLFGIFDGHGEFGDHCSHFAADQVSCD